MADENNPNGGNGSSPGGPTGNSPGKNGKVGLVERVSTGVKDDIQALKTDIPAKAKEQIEGLIHTKLDAITCQSLRKATTAQYLAVD